ncbi:MAG: acyl-[acyl-carrier-protein]--UDP-N-acetylglucosamine O-acyltransferase, partial [Betaproteobacteria bacterium]|nr:acyl-[acyl-carrier-protein]--UDP-N-acetylglucosamine O-acyltransferase [Betaproteobacteria bacterium]
GINAEGLRRRGFPAATIAGIKAAYKTLYKSGLTLEQARQALAGQERECPEVRALAEFLGRSRRGIIR